MPHLKIAAALLFLFPLPSPAAPASGAPHQQQTVHSALWERELIPELESPGEALLAWLGRGLDYGYDVEHYDLSLDVDFTAETIDCLATLSVTVDQPGLSTIAVDLNNDLTATSATVDGAPRPFTQFDEQVVIDLAAPPPVGTPLVVALAYHGTPLPLGSTKGFQFKEHEGVPICYTMSTPYSTEWATVIPVSHYWRACKEDQTDKSTFSCALTVPDTMTACANGLQTGMVNNGNRTRTFFWSHLRPISPYLVNLAITNYQIIEDEYVGPEGSSPIVHFAWPEDLEDAEFDWSVTVPAMGVLGSLFGEYPFLGDKYGMCEVGVGPAIEHQTLTSMPKNMVTGTGRYDLGVVHELAHQWWGDCVTVADWEHVWLNEGFATYAEALWLESQGGFEALRAHMERMSYWHFDCSVLNPPYVWHPVVYYKGAWVLHMLRRIFDDDDAFFQLLRDYRGAHEHGCVVTADFAAAAETAYGDDLGWFFDQWLYHVGRPEYEYHWQEDGGTVQLSIHQVQSLSMPTYRMPLDVRVSTAAGDEEFVIWNEARFEMHTLQVSGEPLAVTLDPDSWVLADIYNARRMIVAGPGPAADNPPQVRLFATESGTPLVDQFQAYGPSHYGVNVGRADVDGDGIDEIITGPGPGAVFGPHVRGFRGDGTPVDGLSFLAYGTNKFGVNVAAGNLDFNIYDEIVTGAGPGEVFGPHVRGFRYLLTGVVEPIPGVSFFAYGTPRWGVNVACGDLDGDGFDEIVTGAGPGAVFGPHVRGWNVDHGTAEPMPDVSFFAYGTHKFGVNVSCGDVDGDGIDELVTGPGPGAVFGSHVRGWNHDGEGVMPLPGFSFFAWPPSGLRYGAEVFAGVDLDLDGLADLIVGAGPDPSGGTPVKVFRYDGTLVTEWLDFDAFPPDWTHGAAVSGGRF